MPAPAPTVHNSLSSVLAALTAEWDRLRDLHQGSELSRTGVRLRDRGATGGEGSRPRPTGLGRRAEPGLGREWVAEAVCAESSVVRWGGLCPPGPWPLTLSLQVSEASAGPRRLHSLSVSSDTTADSFSSLNPEEVGARLGCEDRFSCTFFLSRSQGTLGLQTRNGPEVLAPAPFLKITYLSILFYF